jgi:hypothetical protein
MWIIEVAVWFLFLAPPAAFLIWMLFWVIPDRNVTYWWNKMRRKAS